MTAPGSRGDHDALIGTSVGRYRVLAPPLRESQRTHLEERLRREAQALARLDHQNVVAVFAEAGRTDDVAEIDRWLATHR